MDAKIQKYLKKRYGRNTKLLGIDRLGKGIHGTAYRLRFENSHKEQHLIMKTLFPSEFGHNHFSDRAQVLLLAHANYNEIPRHVKAIDVAGETPDRFISMKEASEFYLFMEEARGSSYFEDLKIILDRGALTEADRKRAQALAHFLAEIHAVKYAGENAKTLYRRRIRELIGHGECIMGIIDAYDRAEFTTEQEMIDYTGKCLSWWGKIRNNSRRLCRVHGDFHPGNIWFHGNDCTLLDRSRGSWGEPSCDVSCLGINYIFCAIKDKGTFEGPFAELFRLFVKKYLEETSDNGFLEVTQPFFAFRVLVLANPRFYPDETPETRRKLLNFGHSVLETDKFDPEKIMAYIRSRWPGQVKAES
jgi:aminoglycoside phosphotransferase family enzyme